MKFLTALSLSLFFAAFTARAAAPACLGELLDDNLGSKQNTMSLALLDLYSMDYVRHNVDAWRAEGDTVCASGVILGEDIYQYYQFFFQLEVRSATGELKAVLPLLFQTSSVQSHDNLGAAPWTALPYSAVKGQVAGLFGVMAATVTLDAFPQPSDASFREAVAAQPFGAGLDAATFFATPYLTAPAGEQDYVVTWMNLVPGTGGSLFTNTYAPKALLFRYLADGKVAVSDQISGFEDLLMPLSDDLQKSVDGDNDVSQRDARALEDSSLSNQL